MTGARFAGASVAKRKRPAKLRRPAKLWCDALVTMQWEKFEAGDNEALFDAFAYCFISGARPPVSLANEFYARYAKWRSFQVRTLDEAFGVVRERTHVEQAAASERLKLAVVFMVEYLRREARKQNKKLSVNAALVSAA